MEFEGFTILREIQVSARSHLHLAVDTASGRQYVIKTPSVDLCQDTDYLDRFVLEEWIARRVDSPHVIKTWPGERPRSHLFVAMEFIDGQTLMDADNPARLWTACAASSNSSPRASRPCTGAKCCTRTAPRERHDRPSGHRQAHRPGQCPCRGLAECHRDALVTPVPGTLQYTAPEYLLGQGGSQRSELFALAAITYQMLTGQLPYGLDLARVRSPQDCAACATFPFATTAPSCPPGWTPCLPRPSSPIRPDGRRSSPSSSRISRLPAPSSRTPHPPLIERNPVLFWKSATALLSLTVIALLACASWSAETANARPTGGRILLAPISSLAMLKAVGTPVPRPDARQEQVPHEAHSPHLRQPAG
jgi:serine/threonine protein kinase